MKKYLTLFVLFIFAAGCTQLSGREAKVSDTDGLIINKFIADESRLVEGKENTFYLEVENVGGTDAENVTATLYGWPNGYPKKPKEKMKPPDITMEPAMPGALKMFEWTLPAPDLPQGIENDYTITGRIRYGYKTTAAINIPGYSYKEWKRRSEQGKGEIKEVSVTNTKGFEGSGGSPLRVDTTTKNVIRYETGSGDKTYSYRIAISNVGQGVPIGKNGEDGTVTGTIKITGPANFTSCLGNTPDGGGGGKEVTIGTGDLKIMKSGKKESICEINVIEDDWGTSPKTTVALIFDLGYEYYSEKPMDISVVGETGDTPEISFSLSKNDTTEKVKANLTKPKEGWDGTCEISWNHGETWLKKINSATPEEDGYEDLEKKTVLVKCTDTTTDKSSMAVESIEVTKKKTITEKLYSKIDVIYNISYGELFRVSIINRNHLLITDKEVEDPELLLVDTKDNTVTKNAEFSEGSNPTGVCVNPDTGEIYVTKSGGPTRKDDVGVLNYNHDEFDNVTVENGPVDCVVTSNGEFLYVLNQISETVSKRDKNDVHNAEINVGKFPHSIVIGPNDEYIYITNTDDNTVSVINLSNDEISSTIEIGKGPKDMKLSEDGSILYVANYDDNTVSVIDTQTKKETRKITVGKLPNALALGPDNLLLVGNYIDGTVSVVDIDSDNVVEKHSIGDVNVINAMISVNNGKKVYIIHSNSISVLKYSE